MFGASSVEEMWPRCCEPLLSGTMVGEWLTSGLRVCVNETPLLLSPPAWALSDRFQTPYDIRLRASKHGCVRSKVLCSRCDHLEPGH